MPTINLGRVVGTDGTNGTDGKSAYAAAVEGGYTGTEAEFYADLADIATKRELSAHTGDSDIHVTAEEKAEWNKSDVFVATYGTTTLDELNAARAAGKHIVCKGINVENAALIAADTADFDEPASFFNFASFTPSCDGAMIYGCGTDGWSYTAVDFVPYAHAANHASGGIDPITPASIGAAPAYTYGTADLTAGTSELATGKLYFVFE